MKTFQVCFGIYIDVEAEDKEIAVEQARQVLREHVPTLDAYETDTDPIITVELDENGDPID